jgi:hypothetical protein
MKEQKEGQIETKLECFFKINITLKCQELAKHGFLG